jgi:hypothetical protein
MAPFRLQFPVSEIEALAARFGVVEETEAEVAAAGAAAGERGFYTKAELVLLCAWKTPRSRPRVAQNTEGFVEGITRAVFATADEAERMAGLCALRGVEAPTASVLLHFALPGRYPIIDFRALESLGESERAAYPIGYWLGYVDACRTLAAQAGVSMRVLDKALWQYSSERSAATARRR